MRKKWQTILVVLQFGAAVFVLNGCAGGGSQHSVGGDDKVRSTRILSALHHDTAYPFSLVDVFTTQGTAHLGGYVDTYDHKLRATDIAKHIEGVTNVVNHITVRRNNP
jgi:osmotically-inducible protein OsmY